MKTRTLQVVIPVKTGIYGYGCLSALLDPAFAGMTWWNESTGTSLIAA